MSTDTIIGIVGGAIVGLIITHAYYRIQKRRRELCWAIDSANLIKGYSSLFEKLEIQYGGEKIENLTVSKIAFWNNGNETIDGTDIAIDPYIWPRIDDTEILDVKVITASTVGNGFEAIRVPDHRFIALDFDYLDAQQGAVIQVIHTGVSILPLMVGGEVKGVKEIEYKSKKSSIASKGDRLFTYFFGIIGIVFLALRAFLSFEQGTPFTDDGTVWLLLISLPFILILFLLDLRQVRDTAKIPKSLSVFEKDDIGNGD